HARIERHCETLLRLSRHLEVSGADASARSAAAQVIRYFDTAARDHHADEETDLFPALLDAVAGSDAHCLRALASTLTQEHRELEHCWQVLRPDLSRIAAGESLRLDPAHVQALVDRYRQHLRREDDELLPMASRLLDDDALDRVGRAM